MALIIRLVIILLTARPLIRRQATPTHNLRRVDELPAVSRAIFLPVIVPVRRPEHTIAFEPPDIQVIQRIFSL